MAESDALVRLSTPGSVDAGAGRLEDLCGVDAVLEPAGGAGR